MVGRPCVMEDLECHAMVSGAHSEDKGGSHYVFPGEKR